MERVPIWMGSGGFWRGRDCDERGLRTRGGRERMSGTSRAELQRTVKRLAVICGVGVVAGALLIVTLQPEVRARVWHWRHGTTLEIGSAVVPAPRNYQVQEFGDGFLLVRLDTEDRTPTQRTKSMASIGVRPAPPVTAEQMENVTVKMTEFSRQHDGHETQRRDFNVPGGRITCLGGDPLPSGGRPDVAPVWWSCRSTLGLDFTVQGIPADMGELWAIVAGIRMK